MAPKHKSGHTRETHVINLSSNTPLRISSWSQAGSALQASQISIAQHQYIVIGTDAHHDAKRSFLKSAFLTPRPRSSPGSCGWPSGVSSCWTCCCSSCGQRSTRSRDRWKWTEGNNIQCVRRVQHHWTEAKTRINIVYLFNSENIVFQVRSFAKLPSPNPDDDVEIVPQLEHCKSNHHNAWLGE